MALVIEQQVNGEAPDEFENMLRRMQAAEALRNLEIAADLAGDAVVDRELPPEWRAFTESETS